MVEKTDVIIVGGGVGGCAIGAMLSHRGKKVKLFDKNQIIGGRCLTYEHQGFKIDLGVHLFGVGDKGYLGDVLRRIERPNALTWVVSNNPRPTLFYKDKSMIYSRKNMAQVIGSSEEDFNLAMAFFSEVLSMRKKNINDLKYVGLSDFIKSYAKDPKVANKLQTFVSMIAGQYFVTELHETSTAEFITSFRQVVNSKSSAYPIGGCVAIPEAYQKKIIDSKGEVELNAKVKKIIIENDKAIGIELDDGRNLFSDIIISNADIKNTVFNLIGEKYFENEYVKRVKGLKYAKHCLALKVGLDKQISDQKLVMYVGADYSEMESTVNEVEKGKVPDNPGGMITSPSNYDPNLAPKGCQSIFFGTACLGEQPKSYYDKWAEKCWEGFLKVFPEAEKHLIFKKMDSPLLVDSYAGETGNVIGIAQTVDQIYEKRPSQVSPIEGLFIVGAEAGGHGIGAELAANSAMELDDYFISKNL
ncbi:MAG: NAD(P)/FAD-dependent oxidoreductase [Candidatus Lokiarchaeota archaeon]|nr:NAD(P)/FAD-dependent oxidoreductase [Candidatus Lokiarchaeota archaeon]